MADSAISSSTFAALVSDTAYDPTTWDGVTTTSPSQNTVRDLVEDKLTTRGKQNANLVGSVNL